MLHNFFSAFINAQKEKKPFFFWSFENRLKKFLLLLKREGFITHFSVQKKEVKIFFKKNSFLSYKNVSKKQNLGLRFYEIVKLSNGKSGIFFFDTPSGLFSEKDVYISNTGGFFFSSFN